MEKSILSDRSPSTKALITKMLTSQMMAHLLPSRVNFYTNNFSEQTVGSSFQKPSSKVVDQVARINT